MTNEALHPIVPSHMASTKTKATKKTAADKPKATMGRPLEMSGPIGDLAEALGGRQKLADAMGVGRRTLSRYSTGELFPSWTTRILFSVLALQYGTEPPYATTKEAPRPAWFDDLKDDED